MVPDGQATLQGLSSIPHLTSVAAALYRSGVINGSETLAGQAPSCDDAVHRLASFIETSGRRAIGIALLSEQPHGRSTSSGVYWGRIDVMGAVSGPPHQERW